MGGEIYLHDAVCASEGGIARFYCFAAFFGMGG